MSEGTRSRGILSLPIAVLALLWVWPSACSSQTLDDRWSTPRRISSVNTNIAAAAMIPDPFGYLHTLWVQSQGDNELGFIGYARFDGTRWSDPMKAAIVRYADTNHRMASGAVDRAGFLHVVWNSGISGPATYSRVAVHESTSPESWSRPTSLGMAAYRVDLQVDDKDSLHLLYSRFYDERPGIFYVRSTDGGDDWTAPVQLDPGIPKGYAPYYLHLRPDETGGLHAVWHYYTPETVLGKTIHYARSLDGGSSWSQPMTIASLDASGENLWRANPTLAVSGSQVHVVWPGGVPHGTFRMHRLSTDRGEHWGAPERIFGDLHGEANGDGIAVDASGRVHWVGQVRYPQAVYHAIWDRDHWGTPVPFYLIMQTWDDPIGDRIHAHGVRLGIRAGNQLVTSFTGTEPPHALYALQRTLDDTPALRALALPRPPTPISLQMWGFVAIVLLAATSAIRHTFGGGSRPNK